MRSGSPSAIQVLFAVKRVHHQPLGSVIGKIIIVMQGRFGYGC